LLRYQGFVDKRFPFGLQFFITIQRPDPIISLPISYPPPVPKRFRRRLIALGSGDPTRAICSSLIAQAFHAVDYPILPEKIEATEDYETLYSIRHHSLFTPRDFDLSPYFKIIKPTLTSHSDFNHRDFAWGDKKARERIKSSP